MLVVNNIKEITEHTSLLRSQNKSIGFVPTMGALHKGHISLINAAKTENDIVITSIFINPKQFNDKKDLENYPRTIEKDLNILEKAECDYVFVPSVEEIYPENYIEKEFDMGYLDKIMEGKHRPGHFNGVALIVSRFLDILKPDTAFFGKKDFQQLAIINHIVKKNNYPVQIKSCEIVRESDGLAMSSRNLLLEDKERRIAPYIYYVLNESKKLISEQNVEELIGWVIKRINDTALMRVEYFEIVNSETLAPVAKWEEECDKIGCIAVKIGKIRLIDNIKYNL